MNEGDMNVEMRFGPYPCQYVRSLSDIIPLRKVPLCRYGGRVFYYVFAKAGMVREALIRLEEYMSEEEKKIKVFEKGLVEIKDWLQTNPDDEDMFEDEAFAGFYPSIRAVQEKFGDALVGVRKGSRVGYVIQQDRKGNVVHHKSVDFFCFFADRDSLLAYQGKLMEEAEKARKSYEALEGLYEIFNNPIGG